MQADGGGVGVRAGTGDGAVGDGDGGGACGGGGACRRDGGGVTAGAVLRSSWGPVAAMRSRVSAGVDPPPAGGGAARDGEAAGVRGDGGTRPECEGAPCAAGGTGCPGGLPPWITAVAAIPPPVIAAISVPAAALRTHGPVIIPPPQCLPDSHSWTRIAPSATTVAGTAV